MTVKNIARVCERLIENGRSADTPVAVVRWGTRADQTTVTGNLKTIASIVRERHIRPPAVMVVGDVVRLREQLMWFEKRPLFGERVLVTRQHSAGFGRLEELGAEIIEFHTISIVPPRSWDELDRSIDRVDTYDWIVFTSVNGVEYFFRRLFEKDRDIRDLRGIRFCSVGSKTAAAVRKFGIRVDLIPETFNAEALAEAFLTDKAGGRQNLSGMRLLMPRAEAGRDVFPERVRKLGGEIDVPAAYRAVKPEQQGKRLKRFLKEGKISIGTFTSAATFENFLEIMENDARELLRDVAIAVIGPVTAEAVKKAGLKVAIMPEKATVDAMVESIIAWVREKKLQPAP